MALIKAPASTLASRNFTLILTGVFALLCLMGILQHEMWRDELQAWSIARDSTSAASLWQNMRTEGHPALWHLCLYAITRTSHNPLIMQLLHISLATANVYLIAAFSPFSPAQKGLMVFGYFSFYEYALLSRGYALGVFFIFLFCSLYSWCQKQQNSSKQGLTGLSALLPFILLALLANTSLYGLFLSVALWVTLIWPRSASEGKRLGHPKSVNKGKRRLPTLVGMSLLGLSWLVCYLQVSRISVFSYRSPGMVSNNLGEGATDVLLWLSRRFGRVVAQVWRSYVPLPPFWRDDFWNQNILTELQQLPFSLNDLLSFLLSILLVALAVSIFCRQPKVLAVYGVGTGLIFLFSYLIFPGQLRHYGHLYILLIACFWLMKTHPDEDPQRWPYRYRLRFLSFQQPLLIISWLRTTGRWLQKHFLNGILICQMVSGLVAYSLDYTHVFSASQMTADYLRQQNLTSLPIFGYSTAPTSALTGWLNRSIYYPEANQVGTFRRATKILTEAEMRQTIPPFVNSHSGPVVLALTRPLETPIAGVVIQPLSHLRGEILPDESFYLYLAAASPF